MSDDKQATFDQIKDLGDGDVSLGIKRWVGGKEPKPLDPKPAETGAAK